MGMRTVCWVFGSSCFRNVSAGVQFSEVEDGSSLVFNFGEWKIVIRLCLYFAGRRQYVASV